MIIELFSCYWRLSKYLVIQSFRRPRSNLHWQWGRFESSWFWYSCLWNFNLPLYLHNLLHVPSITKNLLSVSKFALANNVYFELFPHFCTVKCQATNEILLRPLVL